MGVSCRTGRNHSDGMWWRWLLLLLRVMLLLLLHLLLMVDGIQALIVTVWR